MKAQQKEVVAEPIFPAGAVIKQVKATDKQKLNVVG